MTARVVSSCRNMMGAGALGVLAFLFSSSAIQADGDRALGEYLSAECTSCHQISGRSDGRIPSIVGWPEDQFIAVMESYRDRQRDNVVMQMVASRLSKEELSALATYFASLKPRQN